MATDPVPTAPYQGVAACNPVVKENYPHTFATPLNVPSSIDLRNFWLLEQPLNLDNPFHRDTLWRWIQESIDRSCDWIDVLTRRQERDPLAPAMYEALRAEATELLAYKRACLAKLAGIENAQRCDVPACHETSKCANPEACHMPPPAPPMHRQAVKPQSLMRERYVAAWAQKQALR